MDDKEPINMPTGVLAAATMYTGGREGFSCGTPLGVAILCKDCVKYDGVNTPGKQ